jgi:tetratricopeptide (TPR) repeat protein
MRAVLAGRLADAERLIEEALQLGRPATPNALLVYGVQLYGLRREQGRLDEIEPAIKAFAEEHAAMPAFRSGLALLCCQLGRLAEARTIFDELAARHFDQFPRDATWLNGMDELAQVCAALGDRERAAQLYARLAPYERHNVVIAFAEACEGSMGRYLGLWPLPWHIGTTRRGFDAALAMNSAPAPGRSWRTRNANTRRCCARAARRGCGARRSAADGRERRIRRARHVELRALLRPTPPRRPGGRGPAIGPRRQPAPPTGRLLDHRLRRHGRTAAGRERRPLPG